MFSRTRVLVALAGTWRAGRRCVLPAVRGRTCVGAWAGAVSGGYFGAFALVVVWGVPRLLHAGQILCGKVPNNTYSQDSQEFGVSAGAY